ncbi:GNAT family N-acetyltransferase [Flaviaesturariibacter terrae]
MTAISPVSLRPIAPADNAAIARIIRAALEEFGAARPGTVYFDESTDHLYELFRKAGSAYFVAVQGDQVLGGGGIYPTEGLPEGTCELVKMYLRPEARGLGLGGRLIQQALDFARDAGYTQVYLESMPELQAALSVYERFGFRYLRAPLGNSGHHGCPLWMLREL